jgi:hypothetical protein
LKHLGRWLINEVNEMERINDFAGILSMGFDIGIYLGEFLIKNHPGAYWAQSLKSRRDFFLGYIVIRKFFTCDHNVLWVAYNIVTGMKGGSKKRRIYLLNYMTIG